MDKSIDIRLIHGWHLTIFHTWLWGLIIVGVLTAVSVATHTWLGRRSRAEQN
jgi:nitrogen fixation protein FixH